MREDSTAEPRTRAALVGLGSSLGDRLGYLRLGLSGLAALAQGALEVSSVWETDPIAAPGAGEFLNAVARFRTDLEPERLLDELLELEKQARRRRSYRNAPRTLDLDLLWMEGVRLERERLTVPHPRMWQRRFVLEPLAELAPELVREASGRSVLEELQRLPGQGSVRRLGPLAPPESDPL